MQASMSSKPSPNKPVKVIVPGHKRLHLNKVPLI